MQNSFLIEAGQGDVDTIVSLLASMQEELKEFDLNQDVARQSIAISMQEHVHWFLFKDEQGQTFGTCHLQSLHNYWRKERRYYLGAFYIAPTHRKQGRFKTLNALLKDWAIAHDGVQIYAHIHKDNAHSLGTFSSVDLTPTEYAYCANHWGVSGPHQTTLGDKK